ncbi:hypothetical protein Ctob_011319 [Chrysochromulina tobinii]|uniref:Nucleotide-diphospho-sugar transferase domain-containing protein n=1 Tax=Chrysochromulina tobinii TaxID=1460289 RepID=A0A0M0K2Q8_9EUKA|nr:hypothetical protein Ctob_011319 [Chrysochromulina tobinii]|eukprot:KOO33156.1 hypothetical protein Ctob_011319 [Chrysochromulina sp. CCMP291]
MPDVVLYTGIAIEAGAGALTSFSMVVQRHALIHENARSDDQKVPLGCCRLRRRYAWFLGLVLYGIAAGMKVVGFNMGPFTILGSIFVGVLLVTNLVLGHWLLREELTMTKVLGSLLVLAGAIVCTAAAPSGVPTSFSTEAMRALILRAPPFGGSYFACVLGVVLLCLVFIIVIEKRYPVPKGAQGGPGTPGSPLRLASTAWLPQRVARPSTCLSLVMLVVYPGSLGLNESFVDACARAYSSMIVRCVTEAQEGLAACHDWSLYLLMGLGIPAAVSTAYWLKVVFARYQTTLAIPIEYSTLNFFSVVGGLLFFQEAEYMEPWQLEFVLIGCSVMTVGGFVLVAVGLQEELLSKRVAGWTSPDHLAGPATTADAAPGTASCRRVAQTPAPAAVNAMAVLNRERAKQAGQWKSAFHVYKPADGFVRPGGDLDEPSTLGRTLPAAAADGELMLLCIGGSGSMRAGMNLVMNFRTMGLYHMLILAPEKEVCEDLWAALPSLACVWWPSYFGNSKPKPPSLYNTMFSKTALAFFEARKVLLEKLVVTHRLNVLHLDADTIWFANPYPYFKTLYKDYALIIQTDNPFVNAGILYVQNVHDGDAAAWVLQARFKKDRGDPHAAQLMRDGGWMNRMSTADVLPAKRKTMQLHPDRQYAPLVHLCKPGLWVSVSQVR